MNKQAWAVAKLNLRNLTSSYVTTGIITAMLLVDSVIYLIIALTNGAANSQQLDVSFGTFTWLLLIMAAIFIPLKNFRKTVNLGAKRSGFFWGSIQVYAVLALAVSLLNIILYFTYERFLMSTGYYVRVNELLADMSLMETHNTVANLLDLFGWMGHGVVFAFIQQFAFLLLLAVVVHTLAAIQDSWYGWVVDGIIAAVLSTFIPIAPLRAILLKFFDLILFNANAFVQIGVCLGLSVVIYAINIPILARKRI